MLLQLESTGTDVTDFWRPRLTAKLRAPPIGAGLYEFRLRTRRPAYATLRLAFHGWPQPMTISLHRLGDCHYGKSFRAPGPIARMELELEPHTDADVVLSASLARMGARSLLAGGRRALRQASSPRTLVLKVRHAFASRSGLAFASAASPDPQAIYQSWQAAFESDAEHQRIVAELRRLVRSRPLRLLLAAPRGAELPPGNELIAVAGWETQRVTIAELLAAAEQAGAFALAFLEEPARWLPLGLPSLALELLRHPDCVAAYGDGDLIDAAGRRSEPQFKPGWSPRYQLGADYVRGAAAFRVGTALRELCAHVNGAPATARAFLNLLALAENRPGIVRDVPRVVLHEWREAAPRPPMPARISAGAPRPRPSVSVIVPTRDNPRLLQAAISAVLDESLPDLELVIVDNGSEGAQQRALLEEVRSDPRVRVLADPRPFNFSALINAGAAACRGDVLVLLNDDVEAPAPGWLGPLADVAADARAGCVGALLLYPSGRIQHAGVVLGTFGAAGHVFRGLAPDAPAARARLAAVHEVSAVTGACLAVRRRVFEAAGGFDEALPVTLNDIDFCLRVRSLGYENLMAPHVRLVHHESASRGLDVSPAQARRLAQETALFLSRWGTAVRADPYYSPHLTLAREDGGLREI